MNLDIRCRQKSDFNPLLILQRVQLRRNRSEVATLRWMRYVIQRSHGAQTEVACLSANTRSSSPART